MIAEYIAHRVERELQVMAALAAGANNIDDVVDEVYQGIDPALRIAAVFQVHTQLIKLRDEGSVILGSGGADRTTAVRLVEGP